MAHRSKNNILFIVSLIFTCLTVAAQAQDVSIPDSELNDAIHQCGFSQIQPLRSPCKSFITPA